MPDLLFITPTSTISRNVIYNLVAQTSATSGIYGILFVNGEGYGFFNGGCADVVNNMISLGSTLNAYSQNIYGICKTGGFNNNFYYNTVYIGGQPDNGSTNTACFNNTSNTTDKLINNIFYNACSNRAYCTSTHNAIICSGNTNLILNYNDYVVTGNGGVLSDANDTLPLFNGQDSNSVITTPVFAADTNLHLTSTQQIRRLKV